MDNPFSENLSAARAIASRILEVRRARRAYLPTPLFGEYGWEMMLLIFAAEEPQSISNLAEQVRSPTTTAVRWLDYLEQLKFIERCANPHDKRQVLISLTVKGRDRLMAYLGTIQIPDMKPSFDSR